jgi:hypothetical protein
MKTFNEISEWLSAIQADVKADKYGDHKLFSECFWAGGVILNDENGERYVYDVDGVTTDVPMDIKNMHEELYKVWEEIFEEMKAHGVDNTPEDCTNVLWNTVVGIDEAPEDGCWPPLKDLTLKTIEECIKEYSWDD